MFGVPYCRKPPFPKGSMYPYRIYLGPKATIWEPLQGPSMYYICTWTLRDLDKGSFGVEGIGPEVGNRSGEAWLRAWGLGLGARGLGLRV